MSVLRGIGRVSRWLFARRNWRVLLVVLILLGLASAVGAIAIRRWLRDNSPTGVALGRWFSDPSSRAELETHLTAPCPNAPFLLPSQGFVGFLYNDPSGPYTPLNPHPGIDIFGNGEVGTVPVYAAYDGYLTRLASWKSAVIIRIPRDPLDESRQIWMYYTHMASMDGAQSFISADFPAGTSEKFVAQGTLLGYQGLYTGNASRIGMHVHVSVVRSDPDGSFRNESIFDNTLDPSPYFGLTLNAGKPITIPVRCS
jgi:peptidoglycan LD-endopeptidase LytH